VRAVRAAKAFSAAAATVAAALSLMAAGVSAEMTIRPEAGGQCSDVKKVDGHVRGGCLVEYISSGHVPMIMYAPTPIMFGSCDWYFEARIGGDGAGWVTYASMNSEAEPDFPICTRVPCDDAGNRIIPWRVRIGKGARGRESLEITTCFREVESRRGESCQVRLPLTHGVKSHDAVIGAGAGYRCAGKPISLKARFVREESAGPDLEIVR
jgi:hypothetical protein